jgi:hypothetical protein
MRRVRDPVFARVGHGGGKAYEAWSADELYEKVMGRR